MSDQVDGIKLVRLAAMQVQHLSPQVSEIKYLRTKNKNCFTIRLLMLLEYLLLDQHLKWHLKIWMFFVIHGKNMFDY